MAIEHSYLVAGSKIWNRRVFDEVVINYPGVWKFVSNPDELSASRATQLNPRYIFFFHWSWKVPDDIVNNYECVSFHMTDLPYGRGGSPLQNLIVRGHKHTKLTALRMVEDFDAGPVYFKKDMSLEGSAEEIYLRVSYLSARMIRSIVDGGLEPVPQEGEPTMFKRRKPSESLIPVLGDRQALYDFIRMLDADGYPKAYIEHQGFRYEFERASLHSGRLVAGVTITPTNEEIL